MDCEFPYLDVAGFKPFHQYEAKINCRYSFTREN